MKTTPLGIQNPYNRSNPFRKPTPKLFQNPTSHDELQLELTSVSYRPTSSYRQSWQYDRTFRPLSFQQNPYLPSRSPYKITEFQRALKSSSKSQWRKNRSLQSSLHNSSVKNGNPFRRKHLLNNFVDSHYPESSYPNETKYCGLEYKYYRKQESHNHFNQAPVPQPFEQSQKSVDSNPPNFNRHISSDNNKDGNNFNQTQQLEQEPSNNQNQEASNNNNQTVIQKPQEATDRPKAIYIRGKKYFWKPVSRAQ